LRGTQSGDGIEIAYGMRGGRDILSDDYIRYRWRLSAGVFFEPEKSNTGRGFIYELYIRFGCYLMEIR